MTEVATGAQFEIMVDGKPRSYRDSKAIAVEAGKYLKERHPTQDVKVRDIRNDSVTAIGWEKGTAFVQNH